MPENGLCECGCGGETAIIQQNDPRRGYVRGERRRFIFGHQQRRTPFEIREDPETHCWVWEFGRFPNGYGYKRVAGRSWLAHRFYYETLVGPIPEGLEIDHLCRNRACVNPGHLEPVTSSENSRRAAIVNSKLTAEQVEEVRSLASQGWRQLDIANAYGLSQSFVSQIHRRESLA